MTEVGRRHLVHLGADVAAPPPSVLEPGDEGVDVGATAFAADDAGGSGLDDGYDGVGGGEGSDDSA